MMTKPRHIILLLIAALLGVLTASQAAGQARPLSAEDCAEIRDQFDVVPPECELAPSLEPSPADVALTPRSAKGAKLTQVQQENNIFFLAGGAVLTPDAREQLTMLARVLETSPLRSACIRLVGHSDTSGGTAANLRLSMRRAEAVGGFLAVYLRDPSRVREVLAMGEQQLLPNFAPNAPENRRVTVYAGVCEPN